MMGRDEHLGRGMQKEVARWQGITIPLFLRLLQLHSLPCTKRTAQKGVHMPDAALGPHAL